MQTLAPFILLIVLIIVIGSNINNYYKYRQLVHSRLSEDVKKLQETKYFKNKNRLSLLYAIVLFSLGLSFLIIEVLPESVENSMIAWAIVGFLLSFSFLFYTFLTSRPNR